MKTGFFVLAALVALAVAAVALAPASLLAGRIAEASAGQLQLADPAGTVWRGDGILTDAQHRAAIPVAWSLAPWPLLRGAMDLQLRPAGSGAGPRGEVSVTANGVEAHDLKGTLPAAIVPALLGMNAPVALLGDVRLDVPALTVANTAWAGRGNVHWTGAGIALAAAAPLSLGDVDVDLAPVGEDLAGRIGNRGGHVAVVGQLSAGPGRTAVDLVVTARPDAPPAVLDVLTLIGGRGTPGTAHLQWQGKSLRSSPR